jgi:hypothetical protein
MALDESKLLREFPFNHLDLPADETVILTDSNPTFHRPDLQAVLISNQALYLGAGWQERAMKWRRFPLTKIECATLTSGKYSVAFKETTLLIGLLAAELLLFTLAKWGITTLGGYLLFYGVPTLGFIAWIVWKGFRCQRTTCALHIEMGAESYTWRMPGDEYADEKDYDCRMVRSTWDKLAELGVKTATDL